MQRPALVSYTTPRDANLAVGAFEVGLSLRGKQVLGLDAYQIGMMFTECSLVMFLVQALVFSPLVRPELTRRFLAPGLALLAIGLLLVPLTTSYLSMTVTVALVAASAGILSPIVTYWVSLGAGKTQGADLGQVTQPRASARLWALPQAASCSTSPSSPTRDLSLLPSLSPPALPPALGFPDFSGSLRRALARVRSSCQADPHASSKPGAIRTSAAPEVD